MMLKVYKQDQTGHIFLMGRDTCTGMQVQVSGH
jgi:hypothetical protein